MAIALACPDVVVAWALRQWFWARHVTAKFTKEQFSVPHPEPPPTLQEQYKEHGGNQALVEHTEREPSGPNFLVQSDTIVEPFNEFKASYWEQPEDYTWTQTHSFFALMGGFMLYVDGKPYRTLLPDKLHSLIRDGFIDAPALTARQIRDRSKGNVISKGLVIFQGSWFILQLLSRAIYHLEITQIEVATFAFSILNFFTYGLWWNKPLNVECPHPVYWKSTKSNLEISFPRVSEDDNPLVSSEVVVLFMIDSYLRMLGADTMSPEKLQAPMFDAFNGIRLKPWESNVLTFVGFTLATVFSGIHCAASFHAFPTYLEQVLWCTSAFIALCTPLIGFMVASVLFRSGIEQIGSESVKFTIFIRACIGLYHIACNLLLILMFTTLRDLPSSAYKAVSWSTVVPHL
jgi:hypothetical protein